MTSDPIIWDRMTRLIHWALAIAIILNLYLLEAGDPPHQWVGYAAVAFVFTRALWSVFGSEHSRFVSFPIRVHQLKEFIASQANGHPINYAGHNPLASIVYILMWLLILALGATGFMMETDTFWGEEWLEDLHKNIGIALQVLIAAHLVGMLLDSFKFKRRTWMGMISGRRG